MQKTADQMVRAKLIEPSNSPYNHPAILVWKANFNEADPDNIDQYRL
jgi:hypothetical protein